MTPILASDQEAKILLSALAKLEALRQQQEVAAQQVRALVGISLAARGLPETWVFDVATLTWMPGEPPKTDEAITT